MSFHGFLAPLSAWIAPLGRAALLGGLLAAFAWLVARYSRRLPAGWVAALWWVVGFQFLFALAWREPIAVPVLPVGAAESTPPPLLPPQGGERRSAEGFVLDEAMSLSEAGQPTSRPESLALGGSRSIASTLALLWLLGCLAQLPRAVRGFATARRLRRSARPIEEPALIARATSIARRIGLSCTPEVRLSAELLVPQVMGLWRPVVLLPAELAAKEGGEADLDLALGHEFAHLVRRDLWFGLVPALAERLFFFHPLARLAAREYAFAREAACDARVIGALAAPADRYGRLLIRFGAVPRRTAFAATAASPTFHHLKRRLLMLQNPENPARRARWPWLVLIGALCVVALAPFRLTAKTGDEEPWIVLHGDSATMSGSIRDIRTAKATRQGGEDLIWFRRDGQTYVIRDAATLRAAKELFREQQELGEQQGALGEKQGELGQKQGALGEKQGELGARQGELGARLARYDRNDEKQMAEIDRQMEELGKKQEELGRQQEALGEQQEELGRQQEALGKRQEAASRIAEKKFKKLLDESISRGLAEKVR